MALILEEDYERFRKHSINNKNQPRLPDPRLPIVALGFWVQNLVYRFNNTQNKKDMVMKDHIGTCVDIAIVAISGKHWNA